MKLRIIFEADEGGWITAHCPDLPGCVSQGKGIDDAKANIKEAIELYLEVVLEDAVAENRRKHPAIGSKLPQTSINGQVDGHYRLEATV